MIFLLDLRDAESGEIVGKLVDASLEKLVVLSDRAFDVYRKYQFALGLTSRGNAETFTLSARCLWSREEDNSGFYLNGLEVTEKSPENIRGLQNLVERYVPEQ